MLLKSLRLTFVFIILPLLFLKGQRKTELFECRSELSYQNSVILSIHSDSTIEFQTDSIHIRSPLYSYIQVFRDRTKKMTMDEVRSQDDIFTSNETAAIFDPNEVYWAKIEFSGSSLSNKEFIINLSPNDWNQTWNEIDAWYLTSDSLFNYKKTGDGLSNSEKSIQSTFNLIPVTIPKNEKLTILLRLSGVPKNNQDIPEMINFWIFNPEYLPGLFQGYPFQGKYQKSKTQSFDSNPITTSEIWIDSEQTATIDYVATNWQQLGPSDLFDIEHRTNTVYWMKSTFIGSEFLNGEQILHLSSRPRWAATDIFSFDKVDIYTQSPSGNYLHEQVGDHIPLNKRSVSHWSNFIKLDIGIKDTVDLYLRMEGADPRFLMSNIVLYHLDKSTVFPSQVYTALKEGLFFGILAIQILFFTVLYLIEKERIHRNFTFMALGIFLIMAFTEDNFQTFITFPTLRDYHVSLFFIGTFILQYGMIEFTLNYFKQNSLSSTRHKLLRAYYAIIGIVVAYNIFYFKYDTINGNPISESYVQLALLLIIISILIAISIAILSPGKKGVSRKFYLWAFLPLALVGIFQFGHVLLYYTTGTDISIANWISIDSLDLVKIAIVTMLTFLALSIGYRTNRLKEEKRIALQLAEKNAIIEAKSKQNETLVKEIHHRVKNNLQILSSLLNLQADHLQDKNAISAIQDGRNRVESMGLIHQRLYSNEVGMSVNMKKYGSELCRFLEDSFSTPHKEITIEENIDFELMDVDYAIPLGLIINELVTNSVKYAFQDRQEGQVHVSLQEMDKSLILIVADNGNGLTSHSNEFSTSFGSELIKTLSKKLKGSIEQSSLNGYETRITFSRYK